MFYTSIRKMDKSFVKELFLIILLLAVVIFTLSILFYDSLNVDVEKVDAIQDISMEDVDKMMDETGISKENQTSDSEKYTRRVTQEEIEEYFAENSYETGKKNPFADSSDTKVKKEEGKIENKTETNTVNTNMVSTNTANTNPIANANTVSTNTTKQDTTGRFFENKTSK